MDDLISRQAAIDKLKREEKIFYSPTGLRYLIGAIRDLPSADVRKNVYAQKVIGGGEHDGATCWFECSHCHGTVDINDAYCKHCGAVLEYES